MSRTAFSLAFLALIGSANGFKLPPNPTKGMTMAERADRFKKIMQYKEAQRSRQEEGKFLDDPAFLFFTALGISEKDSKHLSVKIREFEANPMENKTKGDRILDIVHNIELPSIENIDLGHVTDVLKERFYSRFRYVDGVTKGIQKLKSGSQGPGSKNGVLDFMDEFIPHILDGVMDITEASSKKIQDTKNTREKYLERMRSMNSAMSGRANNPLPMFFEALGYSHEDSVDLADILPGLKDSKKENKTKGQLLLDELKAYDLPSVQNVDAGKLQSVLEERFNTGQSIVMRTNAAIAKIKGLPYGTDTVKYMREFIDEFVPNLVDGPLSGHGGSLPKSKRDAAKMYRMMHPMKAPKPKLRNKELDLFLALGFEDKDAARLDKYIDDLRNNPIDAGTFNEIARKVALPALDNIDVGHLQATLREKMHANVAAEEELMKGIFNLKSDPSKQMAGRMTKEVLKPFVDLAALVAEE